MSDNQKQNPEASEAWWKLFAMNLAATMKRSGVKSFSAELTNHGTCKYVVIANDEGTEVAGVSASGAQGTARPTTESNSLCIENKKLKAVAQELACYLEEFAKQSEGDHEPLCWISYRALARYREVSALSPSRPPT